MQKRTDEPQRRLEKESQSPQPDESCASLMSDKLACGSENGDCDSQPAEPVKSHLKVSYDEKGDCLYVVCDSNEPADAEEDDKGILYRRAISDGRLVGITIMNFMGPHAKWSDDVQRPAEPVKVPSDADAKHIQDFIACDGMGAVIVEGPQYSAVVRALLARYGKGTP